MDIGNTRIKWALLENGALHASDAIEHAGQPGAIDGMLERVGTEPARVVVANVAGAEFADRVTHAVREKWNLLAHFAATPEQTDSVRNGYDDFHQLGIDRWLAMIAAVDRFPGPICVVDAGTAITIDVVAGDGAHMGGYIIPGLELMRRSLAEKTGDLRRLAEKAQPLPAHPLQPGRSTRAAIDAGTLAAICGIIDRCSSDSTLVVTGGDARQLLSHLDVIAKHEPQLVLEGLALIATGSGGRGKS